jgi:hypothetical protein
LYLFLLWRTNYLLPFDSSTQEEMHLTQNNADDIKYKEVSIKVLTELQMVVSVKLLKHASVQTAQHMLLSELANRLLGA